MQYLLVLVVSDLEDSLVDSLSLGKSDLGLVSVSNDNDERVSGGELVASGVLDCDQVVVSVELVDVLDDSDSSDVVSLHAVGEVSDLHLVRGLDLVGSDVELDGVLDLDVLVEELEGSSVVGDEVADLVGSDEFLLDSAEFEVSLFLLDFDHGESSLDVVEDSEGLVDLGDLEDVHESAGELGVSSDLVVDLDESLLLVEDGVDFGGVHGELQLVSEKDLDGDGLSQLVGALGGSDCEVSSHLVHHPRLGGDDSLQVFLRSSCHSVYKIKKINLKIIININFMFKLTLEFIFIFLREFAFDKYFLFNLVE